MEDEIFLKEGHVVFLSELNGWYRIVRREALDYETGSENANAATFSTVASGSESGFKNMELLEPDKNPQHLFQVLWGVLDDEDIKYYIKIPVGQNRMGTDEDKEIGFINATKSPAYDPNPAYQFYLLNGWYPSVNCVNNSPVTITPKVYFKGMKYDIEPVTDEATVAALDAGRLPRRLIMFGGLKTTR